MKLTLSGKDGFCETERNCKENLTHGMSGKSISCTSWRKIDDDVAAVRIGDEVWRDRWLVVVKSQMLQAETGEDVAGLFRVRCRDAESLPCPLNLE